jgi:Holliday junction DNA helicase RuvA
VIGRLSGTLLEHSPGEILLDVGGVGYALQIPLSTFYALTDRAQATVTLHVHTHVREDALSLYGFATREERTMFTRLIAISGIGPRVALAILSGIGVEELAEAVMNGDRARLQRIPGIGRKTAERLLLELGDRLKPPKRYAAAAVGATTTAGGKVRTDAVSALVNLGYPEDVAARAVSTAESSLGPDPSLEDLLRSALGGLVR